MKAIAKNLGKLNQYVGEKLNTATKHELSEDFKSLESQTEIRHDNIEEITESAEQYLKTLVEKKKEGADKQKYLTVESFGHALRAYGSDLPEESDFGQTLIKLGETEAKLGEIQLEFASMIKAEFLNKLSAYLADMKNYKHLKGKLESRRLDYDAKLNRLQKSKKEQPQLEEDMRAAAQKYEETLAELETIMISLNSCEPEHTALLYNFLDAQQNYFRKSVELLDSAKQFVLDPNAKGKRLREPRGSFARPNSSQALRPQTKTPSGQGTPSSVRREETPRAMLQPAIAVVDAGSAQSLSQTPRPLNKMVANYSFVAENDNEMSIKKGDIISVVEKVDAGWWIGEMEGKRGLFPATYCSEMPSVKGEALPSYETSERQGLPRSSSVPRAIGSFDSNLNAPQPNLGSKNATGSTQSFKTQCPHCQCSNFNESLFKRGQCNNCFHVHSE